MPFFSSLILNHSEMADVRTSEVDENLHQSTLDREVGPIV
jgi:hypothetical protein